MKNQMFLKELLGIFKCMFYRTIPHKTVSVSDTVSEGKWS